MNGYRKEGREEGEEGRDGGREEGEGGREGAFADAPTLQALKPPLSSNNTYIYTIPCTLIA